jgi:DNA processing protein
VVVSGGAVGIDAAAHEGALGVGGRTWAIAGTGHAHCFPPEHAGLFERIGRGPGAMVWPFPPQFKHRGGFISRNRVLVRLSDAVVVVQAGAQSGALNAASWATRLGKPLWVVPAPPWMEEFAGSLQLLAAGARRLTALGELLAHLGLEAPAADPTLAGGPPEPHLVHLPPDVSAVFDATSRTPSHVEAIASASDQTVQVAMAALLTLCLENVVVEGPPGFFRRNIGRK